MYEITDEAREMGYLIKESIREEVEAGLAEGYMQRILGYHHKASQWVDLDHEDSPMDKDTIWYLSADGDLQLEDEAGRVYHSSLEEDLLQRIKG